jgi:hypothetical protein
LSYISLARFRPIFTPLFQCKFFQKFLLNFLIFAKFSFYQNDSDRWSALASPFIYNQSRWKKNRKLILGLFVYCFFISLPFFLNSSLIEEVVANGRDSNVHMELRCIQSFESSKVVSILDSILNCILPFLITVLFSLMTLTKLIRNKNLNNYKMVLGTSRPISRFSMNNKDDNEMEILNKSTKLTLISITRDSLVKKSSSLDILKSETTIEKNLRQIKSLPNLLDPESAQKSISQERESISISNDSPTTTIKVYRQKSSKLKLTFMLLIFPISFLLTSFPIFLLIIFRIFDLYFKLQKDLAIELAIAKILMFLNNSINIILLIIFGKNIRNDFLNIFCRKRRYERD